MFYPGSAFSQGQISIGSSDLSHIESILFLSEIEDTIQNWVSEAQARKDTLYFSILVGPEVVGQILLRDLSLQRAKVWSLIICSSHRSAAVGLAPMPFVSYRPTSNARLHWRKL